MSAVNRSCTHHQGAPAVAVCTRCNGDICGACHRIDLRGMAVCQSCVGDLAPRPVPFETKDPGPSVAGFIQTIIAALTQPRSFFAQFAAANHWGLAAIFGVICITIGTLLNTLWEKAFSADYAARLAEIHDQFAMPIPVAEMLLFTAIPVLAVLLYFLHTTLLYIALRAFSTASSDWTQVARITGYSLAAYLLLIFPPIGDFSLGHFLMILWLFNLEVSAVRHLFQLGFWRSMAVVIVPFMVFLFAVA